MSLLASGSRLALLSVVLLGNAACSTPTVGTAQAETPASPSASASAPAAPAAVEDPNDPERIALAKLLSDPWGFRRDHWNTLNVPLIDWKTWKRIKLIGKPSRAAFKYGDNHYAVGAIWYSPIEGPNDPEACLAKFVDSALPFAEANGVHVGERQRLRMSQTVGAEVKPMIVEVMDGRMDNLFGRDNYTGAVAAYTSFPGTCLVQGFAVVSTKYPDLATRVRDRWVTEGAKGLLWVPTIKEAPETLTR